MGSFVSHLIINSSSLVLDCVAVYRIYYIFIVRVIACHGAVRLTLLISHAGNLEVMGKQT